MSSIYRKGRDGYFYYQTYVYNEDTGKKDKRIFHSLGTKEKIEAQKMQITYDNKYEIHQKNDNQFVIVLKNNFKTILLIFFTIFLTLLVKGSIDDKKKVIIKDDFTLPLINDKKNDSFPDTNSKDSIFNMKIAIKKTQLSNFDSDEIIEKPKIIENKITIPDFKIEKINILSGTFDQGLINVLIKEGESPASQKKLCQHLTEKYSEFSNIIICIYLDNEIGKDLARGILKSLTNNNQKQAWLAMYTYNEVEGEYFNDNPTGHLGNY